MPKTIPKGKTYTLEWIFRALEQGPYHPLTVQALHRFRRYLVAFGRFQEAEQTSDAALQGHGARSEQPGSQPGVVGEVAQWFRQLFSLYSHTEQDRQTLDDQLRRYVDISSKHEHERVRTIHGYTEWTTNGIAVGQLEQILHRTVEKRELLLGPNDSKTLEAMRAVAILCWIQKRDSQGRTSYAGNSATV